MLVLEYFNLVLEIRAQRVSCDCCIASERVLGTKWPDY
jgi:hypothetical protein